MSTINIKVILLAGATFFVSSTQAMINSGNSEQTKEEPRTKRTKRRQKKTPKPCNIPNLELNHDTSKSEPCISPSDTTTPPAQRAVRQYNQDHGWSMDSFRVVSPTAPLSATSELHRRIKNQQWDDLEAAMRPLQLDRCMDDQTGNTALHILCLQNKVSLIEALIRNSDDVTRIVNTRNKDGNTALHLAAGTGHTNSLKVLLNCQAVKLNKKNSMGDTPLHLACRMNRLESVKLLAADQRVDVNIQNSLGNTPLHLACIYYFDREYQDHDQEEYTVDVLESLVLNLRVSLIPRNNDGATWCDYWNDSYDTKVKRVKQTLRGRSLLNQNSFRTGVWNFKTSLKCAK